MRSSPSFIVFTWSLVVLASSYQFDAGFVSIFCVSWHFHLTSAAQDAYQASKKRGSKGSRKPRSKRGGRSGGGGRGGGRDGAPK
jgi:hypothetical protein